MISHYWALVVLWVVVAAAFCVVLLALRELYRAFRDRR